MITSKDNPKVKEAVALRDSRERRQSGLFVIDGWRELRAAHRGNITIVRLFLLANWYTSDNSANSALITTLTNSGAELCVVSESVFARVAFGERHNGNGDGVVAVAMRTPLQLSDLQLSDGALVAVIEQIEKPGNVGAVFRCADAAGIEAIILADATCDLDNPAAIRASLGTVFTVPAVICSSSDALAFLRKEPFRILAARCDATTFYHQIVQDNSRRNTAIVLGSEAHGLSPIWHQDDVTAIKLPMRGTADSLNISTAAAVLFYHFAPSA